MIKKCDKFLPRLWEEWNRYGKCKLRVKITMQGGDRYAEG